MQPKHYLAYSIDLKKLNFSNFWKSLTICATAKKNTCNLSITKLFAQIVEVLSLYGLFGGGDGDHQCASPSSLPAPSPEYPKLWNCHQHCRKQKSTFQQAKMMGSHKVQPHKLWKNPDLVLNKLSLKLRAVSQLLPPEIFFWTKNTPFNLKNLIVIHLLHLEIHWFPFT